MRFGDARPAVSNTECSIASKEYGDLGTYWCMADGILDEVACDLGYRGVVQATSLKKSNSSYTNPSAT